MAELDVKDLVLTFGGLTVLNNVSISVQTGELFALIGPNGAGKTSVFNCISGIYRPASGSISIRGQDVLGMTPSAIARAGVARTFQHGELFSDLTVVDNLLVGRHSRFQSNPLAEMLFSPSVRREEVLHREAVEKIIDFVELEPFRHAPVASLPFGIQKLVGFARALALEPSFLLLDEPSAGLNRDEREDLARFLLRIKHEIGLSMIWIEHDMQMVADLADRLQVLDYGETIGVGTPSEVLQDPRVVGAYLGVEPSEVYTG